MDIGELHGRVLVFGGPYSNLAATQAMRDTASDLAIAPDNVVCTGDVVAYCAEPQQTTDVIRDWGCHVVMGNCEQALAEQAPDCGCGFADGSACSALSVDWYRFAGQAVSPGHREWMGRLPRQLRFRMAGRRCVVVHGAVDAINQFVFASDAAGHKQHQLALAAADVVIGGHCGLPFGQRLDNGYWLNAGVIGMPANDGTPDGWYLLLTPRDDGVHASWHRLAYPYQATRDAMLAAGVSRPYAEALETGLWPSLDVLPEAERRATGVMLKPTATVLDWAGMSANQARL
ncbi:MAG: metallophosphoesterase family protein [Gammaproteobacteria bacterium]|nr:metallophosphoesterase family protein [Gammaproteobacteria bacterium]